MNLQMRLVIMLAVLWASGSLLFAAQPASPPVASASEPPVAEPPEEGKADEQAEETAGADALPAEDRDRESKRAPATAAGTPQRFTPSEQVRADFDVSFPVDI